jgi:hypothetical protein
LTGNSNPLLNLSGRSISVLDSNTFRFDVTVTDAPAQAYPGYSYAKVTTIPAVAAVNKLDYACDGGGKLNGNVTSLTVGANGDPICAAYFASFYMKEFILSTENSLAGFGDSARNSDATTWDSYIGCSEVGATVPCQISGLTGGKKYYFRVTTISDTIEGDSATDELMMIGSPSAPLNPKATFNLNNIVITWGSPVNDGGSPISAYVLQYSKDGLTWKILPSSLGSANCPVITGGILDDGSTCYAFKPTGTITIPNGSTAGSLPRGASTYQFRLKAYNQLSPVNITSPDSLVPDSTLVKSNQLPGVQSLEATPGKNSVKLNWTWKAPDTTSKVYNYVISYNDILTPGTFSIIEVPGTTFSKIITGLSAGTSYEFEVFAENVTGGWSVGVGTSTTIQSAPSPVSNLSAVSSTNSITLDWDLDATGTDPDSVTVGYKLSSNPNLTYTTDATLTSDAMSKTHTISGLLANTSYDIVVIANVGSVASTRSLITAKTGTTLTSLQVTRTIGSTPDAITLDWLVLSPSSLINGYRVYYSINGGTTYTKIYDSKVAVTATLNQKFTSPTRLEFNSLPAGQTYTFKVEAWNFPTNGTASSAIASSTNTYIMPAATAPSAIGRLTLSSPTSGRIIADWNGFAPSNGGSALTGYEIRFAPVASNGDIGLYEVAGTVAPDSTGSTIDGFPTGQRISIIVVAVNSVGGTPSLQSTITVS